MSHIEFNFYPWNCAPDLTNSNLNASTTTEKCFTDLELIVQQRSNSIARTGIKEAVVFKAAGPKWAKSSWQMLCSSASVEPPFSAKFCLGWVSTCYVKIYFSFRGVPGIFLTEEYCCTWCYNDLSCLRPDFSLTGGWSTAAQLHSPFWCYSFLLILSNFPHVKLCKICNQCVIPS